MAMLGIGNYLCESCRHFDSDGNDGNHPFCAKQGGMGMGEANRAIRLGEECPYGYEFGVPTGYPVSMERNERRAYEVLMAQCDELRDKALLFKGYNNGEISRMLREAADTIETLRERAQAATLGSVSDEIELTQSYDAGFSNGVMAVFQQLEGIESYEELQDLIAEYWGEGEGYDEP